MTEPLAPEEIEGEYEANTGLAILRRLEGHDPLHHPAILVAGHAPFCWARTVGNAAHLAVIVEEVAAMAWETVTINPAAQPISDALLRKHHFPKAGPERVIRSGQIVAFRSDCGKARPWLVLVVAKKVRAALRMFRERNCGWVVP